MLKEPFLPAERTPRADGIYFAELRCAFGGWVVPLSSSEQKVHSYLSSQFYFRAINIGFLPGNQAAFCQQPSTFLYRTHRLTFW